MLIRQRLIWFGAALLLLLTTVAGARQTSPDGLDWQLPDERVKMPWKEEIPIVFVNRAQHFKEWQQLKAFWNPTQVQATDPATGQPTAITVIKIKVPLGLTQNPPVPAENALTYARWELGRKLYFDKVLSSDNTVSCATCHDPKRGFTDQKHVSTGISGKQGGVSAPTVINSAYNTLQFWDGRAISLEDQAQGPVQNNLEMFAGDGHAWNAAVSRVRKQGVFNEPFKKTYGTEPTRDTIAKAIACYERTVLVGNAIQDRAELAMRKRVAEDGGSKFEESAQDYEEVLKEAIKLGDKTALDALQFDPAKDLAKLPALAKSLARGRALFFGKARCTSCHVGDNYTDNNFHNLGVGVKDGKVPEGGTGRFAIMPVGHKNPEFYGAFKTPTLRALLSTAPYMHNGGEKTLEEVIEFYNRGGNANAWLSPKMRDPDAEKLFKQAKAAGMPYSGPKAYEFEGGHVVVPLALNLSAQEKADLVLFLRALQGDPVDPLVADPTLKAPLR